MKTKNDIQIIDLQLSKQKNLTQEEIQELFVENELNSMEGYFSELLFIW